jgi:hypothetical protein
MLQILLICDILGLYFFIITLIHIIFFLMWSVLNALTVCRVPSNQLLRTVVDRPRAIQHFSTVFAHHWLLLLQSEIEHWTSVQFQKLYCICNEKGKTIAEICANNEIRVSFKDFLWCDDANWNDLIAVLEKNSLTDDTDVTWGYDKWDVYSSQTFYKVIHLCHHWFFIDNIYI